MSFYAVYMKMKDIEQIIAKLLDINKESCKIINIKYNLNNDVQFPFSSIGNCASFFKY